MTTVIVLISLVHAFQKSKLHYPSYSGILMPSKSWPTCVFARQTYVITISANAQLWRPKCSGTHEELKRHIFTCYWFILSAGEKTEIDGKMKIYGLNIYCQEFLRLVRTIHSRKSFKRRIQWHFKIFLRMDEICFNEFLEMLKLQPSPPL